MTKKRETYHHNNLKEALITTGIKMIHQNGKEAFSLRKLAKEVGVSATACYNHFENAEELFDAMIHFIIEEFSNRLSLAVEENPYGSYTISMGCAYVSFFAEYPHYFSLLFDSRTLGIHITDDSVVSDQTFKPFSIFEQAAKKEMERLHIPASELKLDLLVMWSSVHGLAAMANMKGIRHDGNWEKLTEQILKEKIVL